MYCMWRRIWEGDTMIGDIEELEEMDASEIHAKRLNAKEALTPMKGDKFIFPVADGTVKHPGANRRLKPSTLIRDRPERGEEQEAFRGKSDGLHSPHPLQSVSTRDDAEAKNDFWSIKWDFIYRHHVEPRVKLYMPREESEHRRCQNHSYITGCIVGENIEDSWNGDRKRIIRCMDRLPQDQFYWFKGHLTDIHGPVRDWRGNKQPQYPIMYGQKCGSFCLMQRKAKQSKNGLSRNETWIMPDSYV